MRKRCRKSGRACARLEGWAAIPLMLRDASQRSRTVDAFELAWAAMLLSMRASAGSAEPTCGCGRRSPAPFHCFGIVIYNGKRNSNVSSRKRALRRASLGGVASRAVRCHGGAQGAAKPKLRQLRDGRLIAARR